MGKKKKWLISVGIGILLVILTTIGVNKVSEPTEKERQITFLKEHEKKITEYVKERNNYVILKKYQIKNIQYDWETVRVVQGMAFSPKSIAVNINLFDDTDKNIDGFEIYIYPDNISNPTKIKNFE
ncbi:hypothetical protein [Enterococcus mundtii]|uniref:Uncharacterized protein n=1 Tax=Enterococcus mundtii TaxID=53346 RepID=A0A2S7RTV2_ENTMU|nr:hypothetical protein [Enterococcus mundtii]PQF23111.1 hypothetical protein CUS89_08315 [Enterococcus mundtii]